MGGYFLMFPLLVTAALWGGWLHCTTSAKDYKDLCRRLDFSIWIEDYALQGHVINNLSLPVGPSLGIGCRHRCVMDPVCVSVNIGPTIKDRYICELSDSDHMRDYKDLKPQEGFMYMGTENPCFSEPCLHDGTCLSGFTDKKYHCECQAGYTGEQCKKGGRALPSPDGSWIAFWWYDFDTTWPSSEIDVLAYDFGHCQENDSYCFGRLPLFAIEDSTEMLAVDSQGTQYKWSFDPNTPAAHAAWRAFHDHQETPYGHVVSATPAWNPEVLNGVPPSNEQDSFMYREEQGVKSVLLDDDGCCCYSTLSFGHAICHSGHSTQFGPTGQYGVSVLYNQNCIVPRPGLGLALYFRAKP